MNEILKRIQKEVVDPKIGSIKQSVKGYVSAVYYHERQCDVFYFDRTGAKRKVKRLAMPEDGNGVFTQSLKAGDKIELSFRNQNNNVLYISRVYRRDEDSLDYNVNKGQYLPGHTDLF